MNLHLLPCLQKEDESSVARMLSIIKKTAALHCRFFLLSLGIGVGEGVFPTPYIPYLNFHRSILNLYL